MGSRNNEGNVRKLYFAEPDWGDDTLDFESGNGVPFYAITEDGIEKSSPSLNDGWVYPQDPRELRLLLLSTVNPDLPLPDTISGTEFDKLWDDWAVGSDGEPMSGNWATYGLSESQWGNRAAELVVQRVDLREWLCEVRIENKRAVKAPNGVLFESNQNNYPNAGINRYATRIGTDLIDDWDEGTVYVATENLAGAEAQILYTTLSEDTNGNGTLQPNEDLNNNGILDTFSALTALVLSERGQILDETNAATLTVGGYKNGSYESTTITLDATNRAPMALILPTNPNNPLTLSGWGNSDSPTQIRYFLLGQQLLLGEPWDNAEVGTFEIDKNYKSLRFDGQRWRY